jgi:hypothetical protein
MRIDDLAQLPDTAEIAVIINAGTKHVATLALLSTLRYARIPTTLIDCQSKDGSMAWFDTLSRDYDFHLMSAALRQHGETLDWIFSRVRAERVLLVDSDAELLNDEMIFRMREMIHASTQVYGSGYLHPGHWLEYHYWTNLPIARGIGYYMSRPWIPFTLLRVDAVRSALQQGRSFMHRLVLNDVPQVPILSRLLWARFRFEFFRRHPLRLLNPLRRSYGGEKPSYVSYDTGADIHEYLTQQKHLAFHGVSADFVPWSVTHFSGITRSTLYEGATDDAFRLTDAHPIVVQRLKELYGITFPDTL